MPLGPDVRLDVDVDGRRLVVDRARPGDVLRIRWLYHRVYGGSYPFSLVDDPRECEEAIASDRYLWLLARDGDEVVASLIFAVDRAIFLGKVFGGVVVEEYRGKDL
ncbi:MAG: hypothetical protein KGM24_07920, partial [Elusimicrobia bacterium]|nr:hypothetical protein [Elusimicrobiota bacterium]